MESVAGISIITPCYNHGDFIDETVNSVKDFKWSIPVEHIIVNDGSTDQKTVDRLTEIKQQGILVIDQENGGPAKARNTGISVARYKYILPLDSDNRIYPQVFQKAYNFLQEHENISVVYTDADYIGQRSGIWEPGEINMFSFLACNQIDNCALIRKDHILALGGYDESRAIISYEDWDLWLSMLFNKYEFHYMKEVGFSYRIIDTSLSFSVSRPNDKFLKEYIVKKHATHYMDYYSKLVDENNQFNFLKNYLSNNKFKSIVKLLTKKRLV